MWKIFFILFSGISSAKDGQEDMRYQKEHWNDNYEWDYKNYQDQMKRWEEEGKRWSEPTPPPKTWEEYREQRLSWGYSNDRYREDSYVSVAL